MINRAKFNFALYVGWFIKDKNQKSLGSRLHSIREGKLEFSEAAESGGEGGNDAELPLFSFDTMANATSNFSDSNKLGEGGFGHVYKVSQTCMHVHTDIHMHGFCSKEEDD